VVARSLITLAIVILLETRPIDRFADVGNLASYARCVDSVHASNRKKKGERCLIQTGVWRDPRCGRSHQPKKWTRYVHSS
jgi:hypothetical protein